MTNFEIENAILEIIDIAQDLPRGDVQGLVEALVMNIKR